MRVLVADDEVLIVKAFTKIFTSDGHTVFCCYDGKECLETLNKEEDLDLLILDILMPHKTAIEILKEYKRGEEKVVLISSHTGSYEEEDIKNLKVDKFIEKPFDSIYDTYRAIVSLVE